MRHVFGFENENPCLTVLCLPNPFHHLAKMQPPPWISTIRPFRYLPWASCVHYLLALPGTQGSHNISAEELRLSNAHYENPISDTNSHSVFPALIPPNLVLWLLFVFAFSSSDVSQRSLAKDWWLSLEHVTSIRMQIPNSVAA